MTRMTIYELPTDLVERFQQILNALCLENRVVFNGKFYRQVEAFVPSELNMPLSNIYSHMLIKWQTNNN